MIAAPEAIGVETAPGSWVQLVLGRGLSAGLELAVLGVLVLSILSFARWRRLDLAPRAQAWILFGVGAKVLVTLAGLGSWIAVPLESGTATGGFEEVRVSSLPASALLGDTEAAIVPGSTEGMDPVHLVSIEEVRGPTLKPRPLLVAWSIASLLACWIVVRRTHHVRRMVLDGSPLPAWLEARALGILRRSGVHGPVRFVATYELQSPAVTGWRLRTVLIPGTWVEGGWSRILHWSLRHEAAHLLAQDTRCAALWTWVGILLPFHPLVAALRRRWVHCIESAVDESLATTHARALAYAECLEMAARAKLHWQAEGANPPLGLARSTTARRIERILSVPGQNPDARARVRGGRIVSAAALLALATLGIDATGALESSHSVRHVARSEAAASTTHPLQGANDPSPGSR